MRYDDERFHTNLRRSGARRLAAGDEVADAADDAGLFPEEPRAGAHGFGILSAATRLAESVIHFN